VTAMNGVNMTEVEVDTVAHRIVSRDLVKSTGSCGICGKERFHGTKPSGKLYVYMLTDELDPKKVLFKGFFCSSACWREYWVG